MHRRWLTTTEAADLLGVHPNTIRNWADSGLLRVLRTPGNQRRFDPEELKRHALAEKRGGGGGGGRPPAPAAPAATRASTQRERYVTMLAESASVASSRGAFGEVCGALTQAAGELLGAATVDVFAVHDRSREVEYLGGWQRETLHPDEWQVGGRVPIDRYGDWRRIHEGGDGVIVDTTSPELSEEERREYAYWKDISSMCLPLRYEGRLIGLLDITSRNPERVFDDDDLSFARVVAAHVATALTNARLLEGERSRAARMEALLAISAAVNSSVGLPRALAVICRELGNALAAHVASLYTFDERAAEMVRVARWDRDDEQASVGRIGERYAEAGYHDSWRRAIAQGRPVVADPAGGAGPGEGVAAGDGPVVSWLTAPLYQDGVLRGLADVYSRDPGHVYTQEDVLFADAVSRQVEIALRGAEIVENSQRRSARLEEVLEATQAMNSVLDPRSVVAELLIGFGRGLGLPEATLYEISEDRRELTVSWSYFVESGRADQGFQGERLRLDRYPTLARVVNEGRPLLLNRLMSEELHPDELALMKRFRTRSWIVVPMIEGGRPVGLLEGSDPTTDRWFTPDDVRTAEIFAAQAVTALAKARLFAEEQQRAGDLELLLSAASTMAGPLDLDAAMLRVCRAVGQALGFMYVTLYDWDEKRDRFEALVSYYGDTAELVDDSYAGTVFSGDEEPTMKAVVRDKRPFWASQRSDPRVSEHERGEMAGFGTGSWLFVPMVYQDRAVGLLEVDFNEEGHRFTPREIGLTQGLANQAAVIVVNAQLYERERAQARDLARTAAVRETLVRFGGGLRLRDTVAGVAQELAGALRRLKLFDAAAVLLHDPQAHVYHVTEAFGNGGLGGGRDQDRGDEARTVADDVVEAAVVAHAMGGGAEARRERRKAHGGLLTAFVGAPGDEIRVKAALSRGVFAPILDQQGESVGFVVCLRREAASVRDVSRAEAASLVRLLCDQAGIAIRAAHRLVELQRNLEQAWTMNEVVTAVGATLDVSEVLRQAVGGMRRVTGFDHIAFWLLTADGDRAEVTVLAADEGGRGAIAAEQTLEVGRDDTSPVWQAIDHLSTTRVSDTGRSGPVAGMEQAAAVVVLPLLAEGRALGAVVLGSDSAGRLGEMDAVFLEQFVAQIGAAVQNARLYERIRNLHLTNLQALSTALNVKDTYMMTHAPRVAAYAALLCRRLGYPAAQIDNVEKAAFLHDIGRIGVPDQVLQKPDRLSEREWTLVRDHAVASADIIKPIFPEEVYLAVRHHHERWDGTGYPEGRKAAELPQLARVLALVDAYDAMTTRSTHARARDYREAVEELRRCAGKQFDPELVPVFVDLLEELDAERRIAQAAAERAVATIDWEAHATLRSAGGAGREHYPPIEEALAAARQAFPPVARVFTIVPDERGWALAVGNAGAGFTLPHPGEEVRPPDTVVDSLAGSPLEANVLNADTHGCWASGFVTVRDDAGRVTALVEADVPVETGVRGGALGLADVGETLDSILRQAAVRMTRIETAANTDGLTGLYNHRYFQERLEQELARARSHDERLGLLFCDLDHFKEYNDAAGHTAGDEALRGMAAILHQELRRVDVAARYGGEEFAVILPDTGLPGAVEVAERIRRAVERGHGAAETRLPLTVSIGAAVYPDDAADGGELVDRADWAMYRAKRKGRNRVEVFSAGESPDDPTG